MKYINLICVVICVSVGCIATSDIAIGINFGAAAMNALIFLDQD